MVTVGGMLRVVRLAHDRSLGSVAAAAEISAEDLVKYEQDLAIPDGVTFHRLWSVLSSDPPAPVVGSRRTLRGRPR